MTREAFENAITLIMVLGGSTNAVLHLIAMAKACGVKLTVDDFQVCLSPPPLALKISQTHQDTRKIYNQILQACAAKTPLLADFKPSGKYVMEDLQGIGGLPAVLKMLLAKGVLHGKCMTVTGKTMEANLASMPGLAPSQSLLMFFFSVLQKYFHSNNAHLKKKEIIHPWSNPIKKTGHLQILRGNLAPLGSVAKITGKEGTRFEGSALVYDSEEDMLAALEKKKIVPGSVVFIRYEGPKGGPGMPEMLTPTSAIMGAGLGKDVALITDGRFSGGSHGFIVGHITPEAQEGGPIALVQTGDVITIDAQENELSVALSDAELAARRKKWSMPPYKAERGTLAKYIRSVKSASLGCVTDE